jgi:enoyl-CoA hydratase/carnithine racemase
MALVPEAGSAWLMPARIGYARAYALLCLGEPISGKDAAAIGLLTSSFPAEQVHAEIIAAALRLAGKSPDALRATKALMRDQKALAAAMAEDKAAFLARVATPEVSERMRVLLAPAPMPA